MISGGQGCWVDVQDPSAIARGRRVAEDLAQRAGLAKTRRAEWSIVVTEAASNLVRHAGSGTLVVSGRPGAVELWALDHGGGIPDIRWAQRDGSSTAGSAGLGLGAIRRLADVFALVSEPGRGTVLYAGIGADPDLSGVVLACPGEELSGDTWAIRRDGQRVMGIAFDGLGHGPLAARSAEVALDAFRTDPARDPEALLQRLHGRLADERGGVASAFAVEGSRGEVAGVGNVEGRLVDRDGDERRLAGNPGTLGRRLRTIRSQTMAVEAGSTLVLATDGLISRWRARELDGVWGRPLGMVVGLLLRSYRRGNDDLGLVALRLGPPSR